VNLEFGAGGDLLAACPEKSGKLKERDQLEE
jgi:hypothetical protein